MARGAKLSDAAKRLLLPLALLLTLFSACALPLAAAQSEDASLVRLDGGQRNILSTWTANHPLVQANKREAELAQQEAGQQNTTTEDGSSSLLSPSRSSASAISSDSLSRRGTSGLDKGVLTTETADTGSQPGIKRATPGPPSLGSRIIGGLRGHLLEQQKAKGLDPVKHPADLGRKGGGNQGLSQSASDQSYLEEDEDEDMLLGDSSEDEDDPLAAWWQVGRHWQPMVNPFVVKRTVQAPRNRTKSSLADIASYLPGMRAKQGIPKIFHQVYLSGEEALHAAEKASAESLERWPPVKAEWRKSCMDLNPDWEFKLWNLSAMTDLLAQRYSWFLPTFEAYPQLIHKVDAVRPFIMHAFGGVYIDMDVECMQPVSPFLEDHELVFQQEDFGQKSLVNSAIAGVPGHRFWEIWQQIMYERAPQLQKHSTVFSRADFAVIAVLNATGPWALRAAFERFSRDYGLLHTSYVGAWTINGTNVMVYPLGTWFVPCLWDNVACHTKVEALVRQHSIPIWLAGHHKNAGSWFKAAGFSRVRSRWRDPVRLFALLSVAALCFWLVRRKRLSGALFLDQSRRTRPEAKRRD